MVFRSRNFRESLWFAIEGILYAFCTQRNIRRHTFFALGIFFAAWFFHVSQTELLILIITIVSVIAMEMMNTAIETVVDMYTKEFLPLAKVAKNVAAGGVLCSAVGAAIIGLLIFCPKIGALLFKP